MASHKSFDTQRGTLRERRSRKQSESLLSSGSQHPQCVWPRGIREKTLAHASAVTPLASGKGYRPPQLLSNPALMIPARENGRYFRLKSTFHKPAHKDLGLKGRASSRVRKSNATSSCYYGRALGDRELFPGMNTPESSRSHQTGIEMLATGSMHTEAGFSRQERSLVARHNMTILPASSLLFQGRRLYQRTEQLLSPVAKTHQMVRTSLREVAPVDETPENYHKTVTVTRVCWDQLRGSRERQRREKSAVILPKIRYEGDESSNNDDDDEDEDDDDYDDDIRREDELECDSSTHHKEKMRRERITRKLSQRKTSQKQRPPAASTKMGSTFTVEKMPLRSIPIAQVKDLRDTQSEKPWLERKEKKLYRNARSNTFYTYKSQFFSSFDTPDKHDDDNWKCRIPHLDDNVRTMMNSTPFWVKRNRTALKPPESLDSIRAHRATKTIQNDQDFSVHKQNISPLPEVDNDSQGFLVSPQTVGKAQTVGNVPTSSDNDEALTEDLLKGNHPIGETDHHFDCNTFVRNSSDFCTPFCSGSRNAYPALSDGEGSEALAVDLDLQTTGTPSGSSFSHGDSSEDSEEFSERSWCDTEEHCEHSREANRNNCGNNNARVFNTQSMYAEDTSLYDERRHNESMNISQPRCASPDYTAGSVLSSIDKTTFSKCLDRDIQTLNLKKKNRATNSSRVPPNTERSTTNNQVGYHRNVISENNQTGEPRKYLSLRSNINSPENVRAKYFDEQSVQDDQASPAVASTQNETAQQFEFLGPAKESDPSSGYASSFDVRTLSVAQTQSVDENNLESKACSGLDVSSHLETENSGTLELRHDSAMKSSREKPSSLGSTTNRSSASRGLTRSLNHSSMSRLETTLTIETNYILHQHEAFSKPTENSAQARKPPLRRQRRYQNFHSNPNFLIFQSLTFDSPDYETSFSPTSRPSARMPGIKPMDASPAMTSESHLVPVLQVRDVPDSADGNAASADISDHLVNHISELQKMRGYGGVDVANRGLREYFHGVNVQGERCLRANHRPGSQSYYDHSSYNRYENQNRSRHRYTENNSHKSCDNPNNPHLQKGEYGHRTCKVGDFPDIYNENSSNISYNNGRIYTLSNFNGSSQGHAQDKNGSQIHPTDSPKLYHHPSCPDIQKQKKLRQQHRQREGHPKSKTREFDHKLEDAVKSRLNFNKLKLIHNRRQGAFSKFLFSKLSVSVCAERENLAHLQSSEHDAPSADGISELREISETPKVSRKHQTGQLSKSEFDALRESSSVKHHSVIASLTTAHELTLTSQAQKDLRITSGRGVFLKGQPCRLQPAPMRWVPPAIDYPDLSLSRSAARVKNDIIRLPPISPEIKRSNSADRATVPPPPVKEATPPEPVPLPEIQSVHPPPAKERKPKPELRYVLTEAEEVRWRSEQQHEIISLPFPGYLPPRLVLISSRMPFCQSMANAVKKDGRILYIVYDFDSWTFQDILRECRSQLDYFRAESRAMSVMIISKGGPGFFYLLKNFVMTPQKLKRSQYKCMREFWRQLANMMSKLKPQESNIHFVGVEFDTSEQGKKLKSELSRLVLANKVRVCATCDNTSQGQQQIELYFDYRKYLLWRSKAVSSFDLQDHLEVARSWSSIEEEARRKEFIFGKREQLETLSISPVEKEEDDDVAKNREDDDEDSERGEKAEDSIPERNYVTIE